MKTNAHYKELLYLARAQLLEFVETNDAAAAPVELDQARVGRLSRMDALQAQAMSVEAKRRRELQLTRINSALDRIEADNFGCCVRCGEEISEQRLEIDPASLLCIDCANLAEQ